MKKNLSRLIVTAAVTAGVIAASTAPALAGSYSSWAGIAVR